MRAKHRKQHHDKIYTTKTCETNPYEKKHMNTLPNKDKQEKTEIWSSNHLAPWVKCSLFLPYLHHVPLEPGAAFCSLQHSKYKIRSESACMCSLMKSLNSFLSRKMCLLSRPPDKFHSPWAHSSLRHSFAVLLTVKHISCKSANFRVGQISSEWKQCLLVLCLHTDLPAISGLAVLEAR